MDEDLPSVFDWSLTGSFSLSCGLGVVVRIVVGRVARVVLWVVGGCVWDLFAVKIQIGFISNAFQSSKVKDMQTLIAFHATSHTRRWTWDIFKYFVAYEGSQSMDTDTRTIFRILRTCYRIQ